MEFINFIQDTWDGRAMGAIKPYVALAVILVCVISTLSSLLASMLSSLRQKQLMESGSSIRSIKFFNLRIVDQVERMIFLFNPFDHRSKDVALRLYVTIWRISSWIGLTSFAIIVLFMQE